jgi:hypothetical protein
MRTQRQHVPFGILHSVLHVYAQGQKTDKKSLPFPRRREGFLILGETSIESQKEFSGIEGYFAANIWRMRNFKMTEQGILRKGWAEWEPKKE